MKSIQKLGIAVATAMAVGAGFGPAEALIRQSWDPNLVAYSYVYYADAAKTQQLGTAWDTCRQSGSTIYVIKPFIPTPYYDETPMYVCAEMGPYLPPDWPY